MRANSVGAIALVLILAAPCEFAARKKASAPNPQRGSQGRQIAGPWKSGGGGDIRHCLAPARHRLPAGLEVHFQ